MKVGVQQTGRAVQTKYKKPKIALLKEHAQNVIQHSMQNTCTNG